MSGIVPQAWPDLAGRLAGKVHVLPVRVYYEDTDFSGIVYHANYLRFAERGRSDFLRLMGINHNELFAGAEPLAFAVHRMEIEFLKPARIDDRLEVHTRYVRGAGARIEAVQKIYRLDAEKPPEEIWRAHVFAACIDGNGRARRLPQAVVEALALHLDEGADHKR